MEHNLLWDIRMPRTVIGILAGAALAAAGALLQTITKNPLASSDTLGINAGAYFMVVLGVVAFPAMQQQFPFLLAAGGDFWRQWPPISWAEARRLRLSGWPYRV